MLRLAALLPLLAACLHAQPHPSSPHPHAHPGPVLLAAGLLPDSCFALLHGPAGHLVDLLQARLDLHQSHAPFLLAHPQETCLLAWCAMPDGRTEPIAWFQRPSGRSPADHFRLLLATARLAPDAPVPVRIQIADLHAVYLGPPRTDADPELPFFNPLPPLSPPGRPRSTGPPTTRPAGAVSASGLILVSHDHGTWLFSSLPLAETVLAGDPPRLLGALAGPLSPFAPTPASAPAAPATAATTAPAAALRADPAALLGFLEPAAEQVRGIIHPRELLRLRLSSTLSAPAAGLLAAHAGLAPGTWLSLQLETGHARPTLRLRLHLAPASGPDEAWLHRYVHLPHDARMPSLPQAPPAMHLLLPDATGRARLADLLHAAYPGEVRQIDLLLTGMAGRRIALRDHVLPLVGNWMAQYELPHASVVAAALASEASAIPAGSLLADIARELGRELPAPARTRIFAFPFAEQTLHVAVDTELLAASTSLEALRELLAAPREAVHSPQAASSPRPLGRGQSTADGTGWTLTAQGSTLLLDLLPPPPPGP